MLGQHHTLGLTPLLCAPLLVDFLVYEGCAGSRLTFVKPFCDKTPNIAVSSLTFLVVGVILQQAENTPPTPVVPARDLRRHRFQHLNLLRGKNTKY